MAVWVPLASVALGIASAVAGAEYAEYLHRKHEKEDEDPSPDRIKKLQAIPVVPVAPKLDVVEVVPSLPALPPAQSGERPDRGLYVGPPVTISREQGWEPVFVVKAQGKSLEWGACFKQWADDLGAAQMQTDGMRIFQSAIGTLVDWTLSEVPVIGWLIESALCFRLFLPAIRLEFSNGMTLWGPTMPDGLPGGTQPGPSGSISVNGWNPTTTRVGFPAVFTKWPLEWPPPKGALTGGWLRNLGDVFNVGHDTWQLVSNSFGEERSWPLMTLSGWRAVLRLGRDQGFPADPGSYEDEKGPIRMFASWKSPEQHGPERRWSWKRKATNRYK